jgi:EpsI family protein
VFVCAFALLFLADTALAALFRKKSAEAGPPPSDKNASEADASRAAAPVRRLPGKTLQGVLLGVLLAAAALTLFAVRPRPAPSSSGVLARLPLTAHGWRGREAPVTKHEKRILGTKDVRAVQYRDANGQQVRLLVVVIQQVGRYTHRPEQCYRGEGHEQIDGSVALLTLSAPKRRRTIKVQEVLFRRDEEVRVVWYFFKSGPRLSQSYLVHQMGVAWNRLVRGKAADILIRVDTSVEDGPAEDGRAVLRNFCTDLMPELLPILP